MVYIGFVLAGILSLVIVWFYLQRKGDGRSVPIDDNLVPRLVISKGIDGIANRVIYDAVLQKEVGRATRHLRELSVLLFKIDYFEQYMSAVGKQLSEDSLTEIIIKVDSMFKRGGDLFAHHGGDEFAVIMPDINLQDAKQQGERIRQSIKSLAIEHPASEVSGFITISIGVASLDAENRMAASELNSAASSALLHAVSHGCNRVSTGET